jgi:hypothetical protein
VQRERHAVSRGERGEVDDAAGSGLPHCRHHGLAAIPNAFDIDRHGGVPIRFGNRIEAPAAQRAIERGIVDQRVDAPERPGRGVGHLRGGFGISHVERDADRIPILRLYQVERRRAVVYVCGNDKSSCRRQASCEFLPDSARSTRYNDDLVANGQFRGAVRHRLIFPKFHSWVSRHPGCFCCLDRKLSASEPWISAEILGRGSRSGRKNSKLLAVCSLNALITAPKAIRCFPLAASLVQFGY